MNHDYAHCLDYTDQCPQNCFRGELVRDLIKKTHLLPVTWAHFKGTGECFAESKGGQHEFQEQTN